MNKFSQVAVEGRGRRDRDRVRPARRADLRGDHRRRDQPLGGTLNGVFTRRSNTQMEPTAGAARPPRKQLRTD